jgi:hypothetical protein
MGIGGDGGASPSPDKSGTGTGERPRFRTNRGRGRGSVPVPGQIRDGRPVPVPGQIGDGDGPGRGPGCPCPDSLSLQELPPSAVLGSIGVPASPWPDDSLLDGCRASTLELALRVRERLSPGPAQMRQCGRGESVPARMWQGGIAHHHPSWGCYLGLGRSHLPEASCTHGPGLQKLTFTRPTKSEPSPQE